MENHYYDCFIKVGKHHYPLLKQHWFNLSHTDLEWNEGE